MGLGGHPSYRPKKALGRDERNFFQLRGKSICVRFDLLATSVAGARANSCREHSRIIGPHHRTRLRPSGIRNSPATGLKG
jgi:hypothetical protein